MRWCCGSGGGNSNNSNDSSSTANDNEKHAQTTQPSTMMTELSLKSGKNSTKLSKNRAGKSGCSGDSKKSVEETTSGREKHCIFQQSDDERHVTQVNSADVSDRNNADESLHRPGVLKSSLKILQSRGGLKSTKGVQYADEVQEAVSSGVASIKRSDEEMDAATSTGECVRLLRQSLETESEDDRMDVSGKPTTAGDKSGKARAFPQHASSSAIEGVGFTLYDNEVVAQKKISVQSDEKEEREDTLGEFQNHSTQSPANRQSPAMASRTSSGSLLKAFNPTSLNPLYDKYGPMLVRTYKTAIYIGAAQPPIGAGAVLLPLPPATNAVAPATASVSTSMPRVFEHLQRAGWTIFITSRSNSARELQNRRPVLVLVDEHIDGFANFIISLRAMPECEDALVSALFDNEERALRSHLPHFLLHNNTDISLCELFARLTSRLRAMPALFAVIEEAEQPIKICDENNIAQYVNRAYEYATGRMRGDVLGSDASEMREKSLTNFAASSTLGSWNSSSALLPHSAPNSANRLQAAMPESTSPTSTSASGLVTQRHSLPTSTATGTVQVVTPILHHGTVDTNASTITTGGSGTTSTTTFSVAANRRRSSEWHCITVPTCSTINPQFVYVKRGSADAIGRDLSLKSLRSQSALVEAPITEALNVLDTVLHRCAEDEATQMQVRDAIKILSTAELYAPTITRFRDNDRIASGYYDGLIRLHHPSRQRKRSVVDAFRENQQRRVSAGSGISNASAISATATEGNGSGNGGANSTTAARRRISADVMNALENEGAWNFDVIELERITEHRPLSQLGLKIFERWDVPNSLRCSPDIVARWLQVIEANYQAGNAYHNATHAADVLQATSFFLNSDAVGQYVQSQHALSALIAATVHDLDHPGRGNAFLMNTRSRLAVLYNDHSVLENHHVALAFQLTLTQPGVNIFARMPTDEFAQLRQATIDMVLATDMSRHFEYLTKFQQLLGILPLDVDENRDANSLTICRMMIKCADIANPTREWKLCYQWAMRIVVEYFDQTAEEVEKDLPLTMKGFDCSTCNIPLTQCTFMDMFAREAFTSWCEFAELPQLLVQLEANYERWKAQAADWDSNQNSSVLQRRQGGVGRL